METDEVTYSMNANGKAQYYLDTGASSHFIEEIRALHSYTPFKVPWSITMAKSGTIQAFGSGTFKFATYVNGKEMNSELQNVYYVPNIHHQLISIGKLFTQGWEPHLSNNGFALYDTQHQLIARATSKNGVYPTMLKTIYPDLGLVVGEPNLMDEALLQCLEHGDTAFSTEEKLNEVSLYNWHRRMGHCSMKTIVNMANSAVMGMVLKDIPGDIPKLDSCPSCALMKAQCLPFKTGCTCATKPLELIHGDLVGPMPVESVGHCKYGFVLMDDYSHAHWVLPLKAKSNAPIAFKAWAALMENGTDSTIKAIMFNNAREFIAGRMKEFCDQKGIHINSSIPYSPSSNRVAE